MNLDILSLTELLMTWTCISPDQMYSRQLLRLNRKGHCKVLLLILKEKGLQPCSGIIGIFSQTLSQSSNQNLLEWRQLRQQVRMQLPKQPSY
jgi:hypothetical protein